MSTFIRNKNETFDKHVGIVAYLRRIPFCGILRVG